MHVLLLHYIEENYLPSTGIHTFIFTFLKIRLREIKYSVELLKDHSTDNDLRCQKETTARQGLARRTPLCKQKVVEGHRYVMDTSGEWYESWKCSAEDSLDQTLAPVLLTAAF